MKIIKYPSEILKKKSKVVKNKKKLINKIKQMKKIVIKKKGIGLSAPQIGLLKRFFLLKIKKLIIIFINPVIKYKSEEVFNSYEGCLSIKNFFTRIKRNKFIKIKFESIRKKKKEGLFKNNTAACIQHEIDHLNGILIKKT